LKNNDSGGTSNNGGNTSKKRKPNIKVKGLDEESHPEDKKKAAAEAALRLEE
jgi:hypothetical protein